MNHHLDQEVVAGFISEAKGYLPEIMLGLESFAADTEQLPSLRESFRYAHIIKGAASMLGFMQISEVAYQLEVTLEMLCEEHLPLSQELLEDLCQNVGELAKLLNQSLSEVPAEPPAHIPAAASRDELSSTDELSMPELSTNKLLTNKLSTDELLTPTPSIPQLLIPEAPASEPIDAPAALLSVNDFPLPSLALTPSDYEESGETILLPSPEIEEEILPEARTTWSSSALPEFEAEESLVSLLDEAGFSVSLPETTGTPTIGDLNLNDVARELKESFGAYPPLPQPEFTLPDDLTAGLPEFQFAAQPTARVEENLLDEVPAQEACTNASITTELQLPEPMSGLLPDLLPNVLPNVLEDNEPLPAANLAFDNLTDHFAEDLLAAPASMPDDPIANAAQESLIPEQSTTNVVHGDTFIIESMEENRAPATPDFQTQWASTVPDFQESAPIIARLDEVLPELAVLPNLPELTTSTDFDQQFALAAFDAATAQPEAVPEPPTVAAPQSPLPSFAISSPAISDEMAKELMETFLLEAEEHLQNLHTSLRVLYKNPNNRNLLQEVRRSSHSLKGTAAMVGFDNIRQLTHRMEDVLDLVYDGAMQLTQERTLLLMQATDALEDMSNGQSNAGEVQRLYHEFTRLLAQDRPAPITAEKSLPMIADEPETLWPTQGIEEGVEASPESCTPIESETVEEADLVALPAELDTVSGFVENESDITLETTIETETVLPELPFEWNESLTQEAETATEVEPFEWTESLALETQTEAATEQLVPEPLVATATEIIEEHEASSELPVERTRELPLEMVSALPREPLSVTAPGMVAETLAASVMPAPVAVTEPVATPTPVH